MHENRTPTARFLGTLAVFLSLATASSARTDWSGVWRGGVRSNSDWYAARAEFREADGRVTGNLDVPALGAIAVPIAAKRDGSTVRIAFELPELGKLDFAATLEDRALRSKSGADWNSPAFVLVRSIPPKPQDLDDCSGWYEIEEDSEILVTRGSEGGLRFFSGGAAGTLVATARDEFLEAFDDVRPSPRTITMKFARDAAGSVESLEFADGTSQTSARRMHEHRYAVAPIGVRSGTLEIAGLLLTPRADKPRPAVIFIGGTGYSTADRLYEMTLAERLLAKGIAVLLLDKRGCGRSTGDWRSSSLADLAGDAIAGVRALRQRKDVAPNAIGLWGVSEGGWIAPLAATRCPELAFIVDHGGPAVTPLEDELDDLTFGIRSVGFAGEDLEIAMSLARALVEFYRSPESRPKFESALAAAKTRPWWPRFSARIPQREDDWRVQWSRKREFDSIAMWKTVRLPALVLIGGEDATMDRAKNLKLYESFRTANPRLEIRVIPDADHGLRAGGKLVTNAIDAAADWILAANRR